MIWNASKQAYGGDVGGKDGRNGLRISRVADDVCFEGADGEQ